MSRANKVVLFLVLSVAIVFATAKYGYFRDFYWRTFTKEVSYSEFASKIDDGTIKRVAVLSDRRISGKDEAGNTFLADIHPLAYQDLLLKVKEHDVDIVFPKESEWPQILNWIFLASLLIITAFFLIIPFIAPKILKNVGQAGTPWGDFGKSCAKLYKPGEIKASFGDAAGIDEARDELLEVVDFLKDPDKFRKLGARVPKGSLLVGPPGCGKTLLAKIIAGESNTPLLSISGSDFVEMFVGVGASRVRSLFAEARKMQKCLIFIDELDAIGGVRRTTGFGGDSERVQTLNSLLKEIQGFEDSPGVILIGATNSPNVLDPALLRPGRFDRKIVVPVPHVKGREEILKIHAKNKPIAEDVDLGAVAKGTSGFVGADLENLINEAAIFAAKSGRDEITKEDFWKAKDKILLGLHDKSRIRPEGERKAIACHEAGHALIAAILKCTDHIEKATILPRGFTGGAVFTLSDEELVKTKEKVRAEVAKLFGARAAEKLFLETLTTGAENDIERAQGIIRRMVCKWGMSDLGPINVPLGEKTDLSSGRSMVFSEELISENMKQKIEAEEEKIRSSVSEKVSEFLRKYESMHRKIVDLLLEKETVDGAEIYEIVGDLKNSVEI